MIARRTVLGVGLAVASVAYAASFSAYAQTARKRDASTIDALLVEDSMEIPHQMAAFIETSSQTLPVLAIQLDVAGHTELMRVLNNSQAIIGISSGATLFCVERLAWDHGYRLTGRNQQCVSELGNYACEQNVAAFLRGAYSSAASPSPLTRAYRPSRADGTLHVWVMQKAAGAQGRQTRREV